jgi:hypothetical protein
MPSASRWIGASLLGWSAGLGLAAGVADIAGVPAGLVVGGGALGAVTGVAMARLLHDER